MTRAMWVLLMIAAAGLVWTLVSPWLLLVPVAALLAWKVISPQSFWNRTMAWRYQQPAAHQPSADAYAMHRFGAAAGLLLVAVVAGLVAAR